MDFCAFLSLKKQFIFHKAVRKERKKASIDTQSIYFCLENYIQLFGSGLDLNAKAWAGLMQTVSTAMFIQGKNFGHFTPSPADEHVDKRVSYQQVHLAFCTCSAPAAAGQGKSAYRQAKVQLCQDEHVAVISKGRRKESLPAPAVVVCKKIKGIQFYSSANPSKRGSERSGTRT